MEESAISSRTSNHRLVCLMELFGNCTGFHPRRRRYRELTGGRVNVPCGSGCGGCGRGDQGPHKDRSTV